jgi:hypothetical protein
MIRKGLRPKFKVGLGVPGKHDGLHRILPFRRSWIAIGVVAVMDCVFVIPAVSAFKRAAEGWSGFDSLFDLVATVFLSGWLLGWVIAPLLMTGLLALILFGREIIKARPGTVEIFIGLPLVGVSALYEVSKMRNLRIAQPAEKSGTSWRGRHFVFDYGANSVQVGSAVDSEDAAELNSRIQMAAGQEIRHGAALPEDIQTHWEPPESKEASSHKQNRGSEIHHLLSDVSAIDAEPVTLTSFSSLALILANLMPVAGTVFLGWKLSDVMVLYWAESAVIGFFNVCKIAVIGRWAALAAGPFFVGHFGGFMAVHFLFIYSIFVEGPQSGMSSGGDLGTVVQLFIGLWPAVAALFFSHAFSFFANFLGRYEYRGRTVKKQMSEPYSRIIFMHLVLIFGGGLTMFLGEPAPVILLVIGLKVYFDVKAHLKERASV